jgi:hypothetical protein
MTSNPESRTPNPDTDFAVSGSPTFYTLNNLFARG